MLDLFSKLIPLLALLVELFIKLYVLFRRKPRSPRKRQR